MLQEKALTERECITRQVQSSITAKFTHRNNNEDNIPKSEYVTWLVNQHTLHSYVNGLMRMDIKTDSNNAIDLKTSNDRGDTTQNSSPILRTSAK